MKNFEGGIKVFISKNRIATQLFKELTGQEPNAQAPENWDEEGWKKKTMLTELLIDRVDDRTLLDLHNTCNGFQVLPIYVEGNYILLDELPAGAPSAYYEWKQACNNSFAGVVQRVNTDNNLIVRVYVCDKNRKQHSAEVIIDPLTVVDTISQDTYSNYMETVDAFVIAGNEAH